jgi:hypothetical protein
MFRINLGSHGAGWPLGLGVERVGIGCSDVELTIVNIEKYTFKILKFVWCGGVF